VAGSAARTNAQPEIDFPQFREILIHGGKNLLLLPRDRIKSGDGAESAIILEVPQNQAGVKVCLAS
jgi:hypothetical protein